MTLSLDRLQHSLRLLLRHKRFAATAILCLGIGIALNTTMYSVLDAMLNPPLAMRQPDRVYDLRYYGDYRGLIPIHERNDAVLNGMTFHEGATGVAWGGYERIVERGNRLREANITTVAPNYFALMGVLPSAGRLLLQDDLGAGVRPVVLGERMWRQLFPEKDQFEPSSILVNGEPRSVVGLLAFSTDIGWYDVWQLPLPAEIPDISLSIVRLKPGVSFAQAEAELRVIDARFRQRTGEGFDTGWRLASVVKPPFRAYRFHWAMIGAVAAVLLIACANLANLQLARGVTRRHHRAACHRERLAGPRRLDARGDSYRVGHQAHRRVRAGGDRRLRSVPAGQLASRLVRRRSYGLVLDARRTGTSDQVVTRRHW